MSKKIFDEDKIHILTKAEWQATDKVAMAGSIVSTSLKKISINSASQAELEALAGIGEKRAEDIISNRPYQNLEELLSKAVLSETLFSDLKNQLQL